MLMLLNESYILFFQEGPPGGAKPAGGGPGAGGPPPAAKLPKKFPIAGVKQIIVVASGKGGVGKSTTAGK